MPYVLDESELYHYGILERSGRYPWGSGERPYQRLETFYNAYKKLKAENKGISEKQIAEYFGMNVSQLRAKVTRGKEEKYQSDMSMAIKLREDGYSHASIANRLGLSETTVRNMLSPTYQAKKDSTVATADALKEAIKTVKYLDVGEGVEKYMGVSRTKLKAALDVLKDEGYVVSYVKMEQMGTGKYTTMMVLSEPNTSYSELYANRFSIGQLPGVFSNDGGYSFTTVEKTPSLDSKRVKIVYAEEGGLDSDGLIKIRRGVSDVALGDALYAQVRIGVDGTHYMKGMAVYSDDMPPGIDIMYYTNKKAGTPANKVFKEQTGLEDNPFGAVVRTQTYTDANGKEQTSPVAIVRYEGEWNKFTNTISSQVLAKQSPKLVADQLKLTYKGYADEYEKINALTNPTVKKMMLESFADDCDAASVHLKAAALPRQSWKVLLPVPELKDNEVYAPTYRDGERVVLFRYPHAGTFEAAELVVNNKNPQAKKMMQNATDAIGINANVAAKMSGADFDGDTALVIPNNNGRLKTSAQLKELQGFDPKSAYPAYEGMTTISHKTMQIQMGEVSNLITDMTLKGASDSELAKAVKHSMVIIDSEKHNLNWKQSAIDNDIRSLKEKYQGNARGGASTIVSQAKSKVEVPERSIHYKIDPSTGEKVYTETGATKVTSSGKEVKVTEKVSKMSLTKDARTLSSGTAVEESYATYANQLKALANEARKVSVNTSHVEYNPTAAKTYKNEVTQLNAALTQVYKNKPLERQAQVVANGRVNLVTNANPSITTDALKKVKNAALTQARNITGAAKKSIEITPSQWNAIQSGALHPTKVLEILNNTDLSVIRQYAMPSSKTTLSATMINRIKAMSKNNTQAEIADALGISVSTVSSVLSD